MGNRCGQEEPQVVSPRRGDLYLVEFDPARGHEIQKTRPALVIQNNLGNRYSSITIVAAITSRIAAKPYPVEVVVEPSAATGLAVRSSIRLDQIRSVDKTRLVKRLGRLDRATMELVDQALKVSLGLAAL